MVNILILDTQEAGVGAKSLLQKRKHTVTLTDVLADANESVREKCPDLCIYDPDILLNGVNKREDLMPILETVIQNGYVVACTEYRQEQLSQQFNLHQDMHYDQYVDKPIDPDDLVEEIEMDL